MRSPLISVGGGSGQNAASQPNTTLITSSFIAATPILGAGMSSPGPPSMCSRQKRREARRRGSVDFAPMPDVEDQDDKPVVVDLVQDSPVTRSDTPLPEVTYKVSGLAGICALGERPDDR